MTGERGVKEDGRLKRTILAHLHVPKTGGTTLNWILRKNYGDGYQRYRLYRRGEQVLVTPEFLRKELRRRPGLRAIAGHLLRPASFAGLDEYCFRYVFLTRDPVEIFVSYYLYKKREEPGRIGDLSMNEFARVHGPGDLSQCARLSGADDFELAKPIVDGALLAIPNEQYDVGMVLLEELIGGGFDGAYVARNVSTERQGEKASNMLAPDVIDMLRRERDCDFRLHEYVRTIFDARVSRATNLDARLADFQRRKAEVPATDELEGAPRSWALRPISFVRRVFSRSTVSE